MPCEHQCCRLLQLVRLLSGITYCKCSTELKGGLWKPSSCSCPGCSFCSTCLPVSTISCTAAADNRPNPQAADSSAQGAAISAVDALLCAAPAVMQQNTRARHLRRLWLAGWLAGTLTALPLLTERMVCRAGPQAAHVDDVPLGHHLQVAGGCWAAVVENNEPVRLHSRGGTCFPTQRVVERAGGG